MAGNDQEQLGGKTWICLGIWVIAMVVFTYGMFSKNELLSLFALVAALLGSMTVTAWGSDDVNKL